MKSDDFDGFNFERLSGTINYVDWMPVWIHRNHQYLDWKDHIFQSHTNEAIEEDRTKIHEIEGIPPDDQRIILLVTSSRIPVLYRTTKMVRITLFIWY